MDRQIVVPKENPPMNPTYSQAVQVGSLLFTSGQIGFDRGAGRLAEGGIEAETKQCLENIRSVVEAGGSSMEDIVKMTVYIARAEDFGPMNEIYREFFEGNRPPAKTAVIVGGLAIGALVEMDAVSFVR